MLCSHVNYHPPFRFGGETDATADALLRRQFEPDLIAFKDEVGAESREQRAESRKQRAESRGQRAESRVQSAESREQRAESREQRTLTPFYHSCNHLT
jgi:prophage tail gpP-like protein